MNNLYHVRRGDNRGRAFTEFSNAYVLAFDEAEATEIVRDDYDVPDAVELIAEEVDMSDSSCVLMASCVG